ncbi:hypothetical protein [Marinobacter salicampi]|uniref:hypothetical protein n=1 Tax=Marinobacter salicampi TaxID=435907 RepID=UPI00140C04C3|nr:hypothetical protein [Marinobacter salicampi]
MMAKTDTAQNPEANPLAEGPVLRQGRRADPLSGHEQPVAEAHVTQGESVSTTDVEQPSAVEVLGKQGEQDEQEWGPEADEVEAKTRQRRLRQLLRQCERVLLLDFNRLAMSDWPDNFSLAEARKHRDLWVFSALVAAVVFLSGLTGFVPAWLAGGGFGAFALIVLAGLPGIRRLYSHTPSHVDLLMRRQRLLREARKHVEYLESDTGLLWQCAAMADFNPALKTTRFSGLINLSERRALPAALTRREHFRLYLIYMLEAEKAYAQVESAYFKGHQSAIDEGWDSAVERTDNP